jgi:hypothetical protein
MYVMKEWEKRENERRLKEIKEEINKSSGDETWTEKVEVK